MTAAACVLAALSSLTFLKAPALPFWYLAIGIAELGHWLAIPALFLTFYSVLSRKGGAAFLFAVATGLLVSPFVRAWRILPTLPARLETAFAPGRTFPAASLAWMPSRGSVPSTVEKELIVYAVRGQQNLELNLYRVLSSTPTALPVVVVVHGGSWRSGTKEELGGLNPYLATRGYAVASIDYRLAPAFPFPAQRDDVLAAVKYLQSNAARWGLDGSRIVLLGRSAGGQLALSAAYALGNRRVKGVIALYAPSDLVWGYQNPTNPWVLNSNEVLENYMGGTLRQKRSVYEQASPVFQVKRNTPPTLMIHGSLDVLVSPLHNGRLSAPLQKAKRPHLVVEFPWATHGCDAILSGPCGQLSTYLVEQFLAVVIS